MRNDVTQKLSQNEWMIKLRGIKEFKATPGGDFTLPGEMSMKNPQCQKNRPDPEALTLRSVCPPKIGTTLRHGRNIQKNGSESLSNILPFAAPSHWISLLAIPSMTFSPNLLQFKKKHPGPKTTGRHFMTTKKSTLHFEDYVKGIEGLKPHEQLNLMEIISTRLKTDLKRRRVKHRVMELEGLGADIWKGVDAQQHVNKERQSWD
jgi:hypothetical protein